FCFHDKHDHREQDEYKSCKIHRQHVHGEKRQYQRDYSNHARREHSRMRKLGVKAEDADDQQNKKRVRLHDAVEKFLAAAHFVRFDHGLREISFCVEPSRRVIVRPFSCARSASVDGATMSISLPSSASFSLKAFASVTAVTASVTLRPRRAA